MNIQDVKDPEVPPTTGQIATSILDRQQQLEDKYWKIENRVGPTVEVNSRPGQLLIKDFLWRITEEMGEAIEADVKENNTAKVHEELADMLHFISGLCLITTNDVEFIQAVQDFSFEFEKKKPVPQAASNCVAILTMELGILGNTLKMKPWKQTDVATDLNYFKFRLRAMIMSYLALCFNFGLPLNQLYCLYYRKSEVNLFRIKSNY